MNYSRITSEAGMVMKRPPVMISLFGRVPGRASEPSRTRVDDGGGYETFRGVDERSSDQRVERLMHMNYSLKVRLFCHAVRWNNYFISTSLMF
jgi:hypothetical protein